MRSKTSKWFTFLLYPENNAHCDILNYILDESFQKTQGFQTIGMIHDRSIYVTGTKTGQHKKTHIHIMLKTVTPHTPSAIAKMLGGSRPVLRLMQRDYMSQHTTIVDLPKDDNSNVYNDEDGNQTLCRQFKHSTGKNFPVLIDDGTDTKSTVDLDIPPEVWAVLESEQKWDSLPMQFYNNSEYPQFKCDDNQFWSVTQKQDISHVEIVSDPKAYYLYLQHKDMASVRARKEQYEKTEFFGNTELLKFLDAPNSLRYQLQTLLDYFSATGVKNGRQALEVLSYGECTSDMLDFYWKNASKFNSYFRALAKEDFEKKCMEKASFETTAKKEYFQEKATEKAKNLRKEYPTLIAEGKKNGFTEEIKKRLAIIACWFSRHPDQKLFDFPTKEEQMFNVALEKYMKAVYHMENPQTPETEETGNFAEPALIEDFFNEYQDLMTLEDYQDLE